MATPESLREEVRATVAARRELGADFDAAVADSLLRRMGPELDARIDERLAARRDNVRSGYRADLFTLVLALGSFALGLGAPSASSQLGDAGSLIVTLLVWIAIVAVNVAHALARRRG
jgi:hypothetical protein